MNGRTSTVLRCAAVFLFLSSFCSALEKKDLIEQSSNISVRLGKDTTIYFRTKSVVETCVWLWESPERDRTPTVIVGFPARGQESSDCSVNLENVTQIQTGWWTCHAQTRDHKILESLPIFLSVATGPTVTFEVQPMNRTFSIGGSSELECKLAIPVTSCRWSFLQEGQTEPLLLTERVPKDDKDCSLRLRQVSYEQVGAWRCGARADDGDDYTFSDTAYVQVEHKDEAFPVEFEKEPEDTEMRLGSEGTLHCKVRPEAHIEDCRWYWQPVGHSDSWRVLMREFLPLNNDCSVQFANVTTDPEGLWTCQVKPIHSPKFVASKSAKLTVRSELPVSSLTREVSVLEGEPLTILCVAEEPAKTCQWKTKALFDTDVMEKNNWILLEPFQSSGLDNRDCSLHIKHARFEHQGLWMCSIRVQEEDPFVDAMPAVVTIKAPSKVEFEGGARSQLAAENLPVRLNCSTLTAVRECVWLWYEGESKVAERVVKFNFSSSHNGYDCGVTIPKADRSLQGIWQCAVESGDPGHPNTTYARPFSLTVAKTGPITFRNVQAWTYKQSSLLECVVREPVEECLWLYQDSHSSDVREFSRFEPTNFNNCSLTVVHEEEKSGWWTCGARNPAESNFTFADAIWVDFSGMGDVTTRSLVTTSDKLILVCQLPRVVPGVSCDWIHPSEYNVFEFNTTEKYNVIYNSDSGVCSLTFQPKLVDVGHWKCIYTVNNGSNVVGEGSFTVLGSPQNTRLSWIVGVLATVSLMLTILLFAVITCRFFQCSRSQARMQLTTPQPQAAKRYSEDPTKGINFSFTESPELLVDFSIPTQERDNSCRHHYERVGRFLPSRPSFYQNVD